MICQLIIFTADILHGKVVAICAHHYVQCFVRGLVKGLVIIYTFQPFVVCVYSEVRTATKPVVAFL